MTRPVKITRVGNWIVHVYRVDFPPGYTWEAYRGREWKSAGPFRTITEAMRNAARHRNDAPNYDRPY